MNIDYDFATACGCGEELMKALDAERANTDNTLTDAQPKTGKNDGEDSGMENFGQSPKAPVDDDRTSEDPISEDKSRSGSDEDHAE